MTARLPDYAGFVSILADILMDSGATPIQFRDEGLLRSAFARPQNLMDYGGQADVCDLAAILAFGIARNHPLVDGNKRAAAAAFMVTLLLNGLRLDTTQMDVAGTFQSLADGTLEEGALAQWARTRIIEDQRFLDRLER